MTRVPNASVSWPFSCWMHANTVATPSNRRRSRAHRPEDGHVRIIAGRWRGRKLPVAALAGLRPTGDRLRETLFNWLQRDIAQSHCLDLFAGSGALGFEALSRSAASVTLVEPNTTAFANLEASIETLGCAQGGQARALNSTAQQFLSQNSQPFDIVFIDPPFDAGLQWDMVEALCPNHLSDEAVIFVEAPRRQTLPEAFPAELPGNLYLDREKILGEVCARLLRRKQR